jgi:hypothetical protein
MSQTIDKKTAELVNVIDDCVKICNNCVTKDLREPDVPKMIRCIQLDIDCSDICTLASRYLSRDSEFSNDILDKCAKICDSCAEECEKHPDMPHCVECAKICRKCAQECRRFRSNK